MLTISRIANPARTHRDEREENVSTGISWMNFHLAVVKKVPALLETFCGRVM
jgi:hypothetical protein